MKKLLVILLAVFAINVLSIPETAIAQDKKVIKVKSKEEAEKLKAEQEKEVAYKKSLNAANELYRVGKYSEAIKKYKESISLNSDNPKAYYGLGLCYSKLNQFSNAIDNFQKSIQQDKSFWKAYYGLGNAYLKINKFNEAINAYVAASKIENYYKIYYQIGYVYFKKNNHAKAAEYYKMAVDVKPNYDKGWLNLAASYLELKNYSAAVNAANRALKYLKKRNDKAKANYLLGEAYLNLNQLSNAKSAFQEVLNLVSSGFYYGGANFGLGVIAKKSGQKTIAKSHFQKALSSSAWRAKAEYELKRI